ASLVIRPRKFHGEFAEIPENKRYKIRFVLYNDSSMFIDHTTSLPEILGKSVTISFDPETEADWAVIEEFGGVYESPAHLLRLKPILKVEHQTVAEGEGGVGLGVRNNFDMHFIAPHPTQDSYTEIITNKIVTGSHQAVGFAVGSVAPEVLMPQPLSGEVSTDQLKGGKLWETAMIYLNNVNRAREEAGKTLRLVCVKDVDEAIVGDSLHVASSFGPPLSVEWKGLQIDADRIISTPVSVDASYDHGKAFMHLIGAEGSVAENRIFEDYYEEEAISAIKILALAGEAGIPICTIRDGIYEDCPGLDVSEDVMNAVSSALAEGRVVTIPEKEIQHFNWKGSGYIDLDPTLNGGYMIAGGHAGGTTVKGWVNPAVAFFMDMCRSRQGGSYVVKWKIHFPIDGAVYPWFAAFEFMEFNKLFMKIFYTIRCIGYFGDVWKSQAIVNLAAAIEPGDYDIGVLDEYGRRIQVTLVNVELTV
ncbi:MAG: hypothetical protein GY859_42790, partial [Desulfobacterales bacterium]|nr:hypothetical protein [Desulfobacterales bacterium]